MDRIVSNLLSQFIVSNFLFQTFKEKKKKKHKTKLQRLLPLAGSYTLTDTQNRCTRSKQILTKKCRNRQSPPGLMARCGHTG